ncbi:MAG TPA: DNA-3-methyladenine glycosylase [bacterium]|jgi:DNA-3-methyladenine glycosylase|nr:DNA-3-methyladenine glycosylase [bacterium]
MTTNRFSSSFFNRDALEVASDLLGHFLVRNINGTIVKAMIVETEAYCGAVDKGCHAFGNRRTKRTEAMFLPGGHAYIYLIYGLNYCLNVVTEKKDNPHAVLIRAVEPVEGLDIIKQNRPKIEKTQDLTNGPGKLAKALNIDISLNCCDMVKGNELYLEKNPELPKFSITSATRIGIDYAQGFKDKLWRKYITGNIFVSRKQTKN